jgi:sec-independent protein translocase protein TatB
MFDIGFSELLLLALVGLLVLGPKRLQTVAGRLGISLGSGRQTATRLRRQLERETGFKEVVERVRPKLRVVPRDPSKSTRPRDRRNV